MGSVPGIWSTRSGDDDRQFGAEFVITFEDQYAARHLRASELTFGKYAGALGALVLLGALALAYGQWQERNMALAVGAVVLAVPVTYLLARLTFGFVRDVVRGFWKGFFQRRGMIDRPVTIHMNASGYSMEVGSHNIHSGWDRVLAVEEDAERYFLFYEQEYVYIVPKRAFEDDELRAVDLALREWCSGKFREIRRG